MSEPIDCITEAKLRTLTHNIDQWRFRMTPWEREFATDCVVRYRNYAENIRLTTKQRNHLAALVNKCEL